MRRKSYRNATALRRLTLRIFIFKTSEELNLYDFCTRQSHFLVALIRIFEYFCDLAFEWYIFKRIPALIVNNSSSGLTCYTRLRRYEFTDWLLQHCSCSSTKDRNGQVTACVERCCACRHRHLKVWPRPGSDTAWRTSLARRSRPGVLLIIIIY